MYEPGDKAQEPSRVSVANSNAIKPNNLHSGLVIQDNRKSTLNQKKTQGTSGQNQVLQRKITTSPSSLSGDSKDAVEQIMTVLASSSGESGDIYRSAKSGNFLDLHLEFTNVHLGSNLSISAMGGTQVLERNTGKQLLPHNKYTAEDIKSFAKNGLLMKIYVHLPQHKTIGKMLATLVHEIGVHGGTWLPLIRQIKYADQNPEETPLRVDRSSEEVASNFNKVLPSKELDDHTMHAKESHPEYNLLKTEMHNHLWWSSSAKWKKVYADFDSETGKDIDEHRMRIIKEAPKYDPEMIKNHKAVKGFMDELADTSKLNEQLSALKAFSASYDKPKSKAAEPGPSKSSADDDDDDFKA